MSDFERISTLEADKRRLRIITYTLFEAAAKLVQDAVTCDACNSWSVEDGRFDQLDEALEPFRKLVRIETAAAAIDAAMEAKDE